MQKNASLLAIVAVDTAENEPSEVCQRACRQAAEEHDHTANHQTLEGSFSAVWTATIASKDAFFCIFRDLQDLHSFAPLESQVEKNTMKNHLENPDEQASSKQSPGEQYRAGKQTSDKNY